MAEIILKSVGIEKVKVIKVYREITGVGLKEATDEIETVMSGNLVKIDVDPSAVDSVITMFGEAGAIACRTQNSYNQTEAIDRGFADAAGSRDADKSKQMTLDSIQEKKDESNSNELLLYVDKRISETTVFRSAQELLCCKMLGMVFWIWLGIAVLINSITVVFLVTNFGALSFDDEETSITFIILSVISIVIDTGGKRILGLVMEKMYMKQPLRSFGGIIHSKIDMNALVLFLNNSLKELSPLWSDSIISRDGKKIELSFNGMMVWVQFSTMESQGGAGKGVYYSIGLDRQSTSVFKLDSQIKAVPILRAIIDYYELITKESNT